jgi:hypothetical protein
VIAPYRPHGPAPESETTLLVIAKPPLPGRVKTRFAAQVRELGPVLDLASSACPGGTTARERQ